VCTTRLATVVVHVDDPRPGTALLGDLVQLGLLGNPLPRSRNWRIPQELDGAGQETAATANRVQDLRHDGEHLLSDRPVRGEVVLATKQVVVVSLVITHAEW
jgi:hypothetical protein